jgi:putative transposase
VKVARPVRRAGQGNPPRRKAGRAPWSDPYTKLRGPAKGIWFQLYVLIDIYSRFNPSWIISPVEDSALAADFIAEAIDRNGAAPHTVHADRGTSMTSKPVSALLTDLGVTRSHSRPRVSNDCPFSEAQFKTLKYLPEFPKAFASLAHAREFCAGFFHEYNYIHRHSGIAWHTPASVHFGTADAIDQERQNTLTAAYYAHPERFGRRPHPPVMPTQSWINQPETEPQMN